MIFTFFVRFQSFYSKLKSIYLRCWEGQIKSHLPENVVFSVSDLPLYYTIRPVATLSEKKNTRSIDFCCADRFKSYLVENHASVLCALHPQFV